MTQSSTTAGCSRRSPRRPRRRCGLSARPTWTSPPSAACRWWSTAATRPRRGWSTSAAWTGEELRLEVLWDPDVGLAFGELPGANGTRSVPLDPWLAEALDAFIARHDVAVTGEAVDVLERLLAEHRDAADAVRRSRATEAEPIPETAAVLGGEPAPFQWAAVRYALEARGTFLADEQGLGKTVEALTALEADGAYPAVVVCPASMKLGWERETQALAAPPLGDRGPRARHGPGRGRDHDRQLRGGRRPLRDAHAQAPARDRRRRVALLQEPPGQAHPGGPPAGRGSHARRPAPGAERNPGAQPRRGAHRAAAHHRAHGGLRLRRAASPGSSAAWSPRSGCTGTCAAPASCAGSSPRSSPSCRPSARWSSRWRSTTRPSTGWPSATSSPGCAPSRWISPSSTPRSPPPCAPQRLAQLGTLQRLAARGKLAAALAWIEDFLASEEPLVVFARHVEVQQAVLARFPDALHLLGDDSLERARGRHPAPSRSPMARRP